MQEAFVASDLDLDFAAATPIIANTAIPNLFFYCVRTTA